MPDAWITALREELGRCANPERAASMQAYMKSSMPFYGVSTPALRKTCRLVFAAHSFSSFDAWQDAAVTLWRGARFREERHAAIELTGYKLYRDFQTLEAMPMYEEMIVTGAWWDYVDAVAIHRVGPILLKNPGPMKKLMKSWSRSPDLWRRRTSIICQVSFKDKTDLRLLYGCIEPNLGDREFFIRKAIGWALRQHAWTDAAEIARYVTEHEARLSGLSRREALKNIG
jgi:3-methyladenine DNA glycosylase AlkD